MQRDDFGTTPTGPSSYGAAGTGGGADLSGARTGGAGMGTQVASGAVGQESSAESGSQGGSPIRSRAREVAGRVAGQAREQVGRAGEQARSRIEEGKGQIADRIDRVAQAFHRTSATLSDEGQPELARYTDQLAGTVERITGYLRDHDTQALLNDVRGIANRQPAVFLAGAFALGLLAGRFFRSSEQRTYDESDFDYESGGTMRYAGYSEPLGGYGGSGTGPATGSEGPYAPI